MLTKPKPRTWKMWANVYEDGDICRLVFYRRKFARNFLDEGAQTIRVLVTEIRPKKGGKK